MAHHQTAGVISDFVYIEPLNGFSALKGPGTRSLEVSTRNYPQVNRFGLRIRLIRPA
jgi:hypothetical protein